MMKQLIALAAFVAIGCDNQPQQSAATPPGAASNQVLASQGPASKPPAVVPMPKDQAELDRLILAGYTPHMDHLHPPGVKACPLTKDTEAVM
jgi:hypothetical protein